MLIQEISSMLTDDWELWIFHPIQDMLIWNGQLLIYLGSEYHNTVWNSTYMNRQILVFLEIWSEYHNTVKFHWNACVGLNHVWSVPPENYHCKPCSHVPAHHNMTSLLQFFRGKCHVCLDFCYLPTGLATSCHSGYILPYRFLHEVMTFTLEGK